MCACLHARETDRAVEGPGQLALRGEASVLTRRLLIICGGPLEGVGDGIHDDQPHLRKSRNE